MDRTYFFNIMHTLNQEYTASIIKHAESQRHSAATAKNAEQTIQVSAAWWDALQSQPFISCKFTCHSLILYRVEGYYRSSTQGEVEACVQAKIEKAGPDHVDFG